MATGMLYIFQLVMGQSNNILGQISSDLKQLQQQVSELKNCPGVQSLVLEFLQEHWQDWESQVWAVLLRQSSLSLVRWGRH